MVCATPFYAQGSYPLSITFIHSLNKQGLVSKRLGSLGGFMNIYLCGLAHKVYDS